jgi:hypothetical protein
MPLKGSRVTLGGLSCTSRGCIVHQSIARGRIPDSRFTPPLSGCLARRRGKRGSCPGRFPRDTSPGSDSDQRRASGAVRVPQIWNGRCRPGLPALCLAMVQASVSSADRASTSEPLPELASSPTTMKKRRTVMSFPSDSEIVVVRPLTRVSRVF